MGTIVTPNLSLIEPDEDESIKAAMPTFPGWASQNATNMDNIDKLFRASNSTYAATLTPDGGGFVIGSGGVSEGKFIRVFQRMVLGYFRFIMGTTSFAAGSGVYRINIPTGVAAEFDSVNDGMAVGKAVFYDSTASATSSAFTVTYNPDDGKLYLTPPTGGAWSATNPVVLGQSDRISGYFYYPTSDA